MSEVNVLMAGPSDTIEISYEQLSTGKFIRAGNDLTINTNNLFGDTETVLLKNYFLTSPSLVTQKGSILKSDIVNLLAINSQPLDHGMIAFEDPQAIGKITIADGPVVIQRVDQFIELQVGDLIYLNDIVESKTGSVGIAFLDGTTLSIDAGSKMVVDEFVYDPGNTGAINLNVISGNFSYISGEVSKLGGDVNIVTPTAILTIQGTMVTGKVAQEGEESQFVLLPNADGTVGQILITNQSGSVLLTEAFESTSIASAFMPPTVPVIIPEEIVLKKFGTTINTIQKTKKLAKQEAEEEEAEDPFDEEVSEEELEEMEEELEEETEDVTTEPDEGDDPFEEDTTEEEDNDDTKVSTGNDDDTDDNDNTNEDTDDNTDEDDDTNEDTDDGNDFVTEPGPIVTEPDPDPVDPPVIIIGPPDPVEPPPVVIIEEPPEEEDDPEPETNVAPTFETTSAVSVAESLSNGSTVATMSATDTNIDTSLNTLTYSITAGNDEGKFQINSSTGVITYVGQAQTLTNQTFESFSNGATATGWTGDNGVLDTNKWTTVLGKINGSITSEQDVYKTFDYSSDYAGKRVAIDFLFWEWGTWDAHNYGPDGGTEQFRVYVNDTNVVADDRRKDGFGAGDKKYGVETQSTGWDPVQDGSIYGDEEGELYTVYGTLDDDGDLKLGFGVRVGEGINNESGSIDNLKIHLTDLNYEDNQQYVLTVQASDGSLSATTTQTINVTDVNEAPRTEDARDPVTVAENVADNTNIASIFAEDPDGDDVTYSITAGNTNSKFSITYYNSTNSGLIETNGSLDYETTSQYTLTITATDEGGLTTTTTQVVNVTDIAEAPTGVNDTGIINEDGTLTISNGASANSITSGAITWDSSPYDISGQENLPASLTFNNDGTKMFVAGNTGDDINEYTLSTAWDVSTASYDSNFDLSGQLNEAFGVAWNSDGTKMFIADAGGGDDINEYTLTTGFDVSTASFVDALDVSGQDSRPCGIRFNNDGTKLYVTGFYNDFINEYNLSTAYDISSGSYSKQFDVDDWDTSPRDVQFNPTGTRMWVVGGAGDDINEFTLSTGFDVSTASFVDKISVSSQDGNPFSMAFNSDGSKMFMLGYNNDRVNEYSLTSPYNLINVSGEHTGDVLENDTIGTSDTLTVASIRLGATEGSGNAGTLGSALTGTYGQLTMNANGSYTYVANQSAADDLDAGDVVTDSFNYTVTASNGENDDNATLIITVNGINDAPTLASMNNVSLAESVSSGTSVATASGSDADDSASLTYSITSGNDAGKFAINSSTGAITTAATLDYETTTSYTLAVQVSDGTSTASTNQVVNITDVDETTQYTKSTNSGTATSVWGASYSTDTVLNNAWAESKILSIGRYTTSHPSELLDTTKFENMGYTVARHGTTKIDNWSRKQLTQYEQIWDFQINDTSLTTAESNQWKTYLRDGGIIHMQGENSGWDSRKNAVIEKFASEIDSAVGNSYASMISGNISTTNTTMTVGAAYNVYDSSDGEGTGSSYTITGGQEYDGVAAGQFHDDYMGDGSLITTYDDGDSGFVAEWGGDVTDAGYIGTFVGYLNTKTSDSYMDFEYDLIEWGEQEAKAITGGIVTDTEYLPIGGLKTTYGWTNTANNTKSYVEAYNLGNNVYIGGGFEHLDWVWDDGAQITVASTETGYSVSSQETGPRELAFSSDGTKFFVIGYQGTDVGEYHMSTAWDVSTASYDSAFSLSSQEGYPHGLAFNTDGTKMFVSGYAGDDVNEYSLSTGWDVSTASFVDSFDVSSQDTAPRGLAFSSDGTKMFISGDAGDTIEEYTLSTGFDVSSASHTDSMDISSYDTDPRGIAFNDDGKIMFFHGQQNDKIHSWNLSTGYDISTGTYIGSQSLSSFDTGAEAIVFSSDGSKLFVSGNDDNTIDEYTLFSGFDDWDKAYVAVNSDMDGSSTSDAPTRQDDHYLVVGADTDGDANLWEQGDVFDLDKIFIKDDSEDYLIQDADASGDYYFKITPVTYANSQWNVETDNTVTVSNTTGYNDYLDLTSNSDFDDINYAIIETESALISEVIATY